MTENNDKIARKIAEQYVTELKRLKMDMDMILNLIIVINS